MEVAADAIEGISVFKVGEKIANKGENHAVFKSTRCAADEY